MIQTEISYILEVYLFVGDGGSDELSGAKKLGMRTVFTEFLEKKSLKKKSEIIPYADYCINQFSDLKKIIIDQ